MAYLKPFLNYTALDFDKYHRNAFKNASEKTHTGFPNCSSADVRAAPIERHRRAAQTHG